MAEKTISLLGLTKAAVLAMLYNAATPRGFGFLEYDPAPMPLGEAHDFLTRRQVFDRIKGRTLNIDLSGDELDPAGYDAHNGENMAEFVIELLLDSSDTNPPQIRNEHAARCKQAALKAEEQAWKDLNVRSGIGVDAARMLSQEFQRLKLSLARVLP